MSIIFLKEKVKNLPSTPGVYLMKDSKGTIIYVGKAKNLKRRVQSYFQQSKAHPQKIKKLVSNIEDFDFIRTDTEFEAFMLECKLIKELKPLFNKMMKSPQSYSYILIEMDKAFRTIEITNTKEENEGRLYFGPFPSKKRVEQAIMGIKESFKILCSSNKINNAPCLNYSLGLCIGMCRGDSAISEYNKILDNIIGLLSGTNMEILVELRQQMTCASRNFDFEAAAKYRDRIEAINFLIKKEKVIEFTEQDHNLAVVEYLSDETCKLFLIKRNKILFSKKFDFDGISVEQLGTLILTNFTNDSFQSFKELGRDELDEAQIIYNFIKSSDCRYITIPKKWIPQQNRVNIEKALHKLLSDKIKAQTT